MIHFTIILTVSLDLVPRLPWIRDQWRAAKRFATCKDDVVKGKVFATGRSFHAGLAVFVLPKVGGNPSNVHINKTLERTRIFCLNFSPSKFRDWRCFQRKTKITSDLQEFDLKYS